MENNNLQVQTSSQVQLNTERISRLSTKNLNDGLVLADVIGDKLNAGVMTEATAILQIAYGKEYSEEKLTLLYGMCREDDWSAKRFMDTLRWIIRNKPFPDWKIADFFTAPLLKLHPRSWMNQQVSMGNKCKCYKVGEHFLYALASDDVPIPEYVSPVRYEARPLTTEEPLEPCTDERREEILRELKDRATVTKVKYSMTTPLGKIAEEL